MGAGRDRNPRQVEAGGRPADGGSSLRVEGVRTYVPLAALGVAALSAAAASSVATDPGSGAWTASVSFPQAVAFSADVGWAGAALVFAFLSFRRGEPFQPRRTAVGASIAVALHLATVVVGLWRIPESSRYFDLSIAALVVLELSILGSLGWLRRTAGRAPLAGGDRARPPALRLLGVLFAASLTVAAVTSAGMAASTAGHLAVPHSGAGGHGSHQPAQPEQNPYLSPGHQGHHH